MAETQVKLGVLKRSVFEHALNMAIKGEAEEMVKILSDFPIFNLW